VKEVYVDNTLPQQGWNIAEGSFWLPKQSSTIAPEIDFGWDVALWLGVILFIMVIVPMVLFVVQYRRKKADEIGAPTGHNTMIEITWSVIPLAIVMGTFIVGFRGWMHASIAPGDSYEIAVTAKKWAWAFTYPNGATTDELHVPAGRPVKLIMSSQDVLHSFYIPEFRVKNDVIPGSYSSVWFEADQPVEEGKANEYTLLCAEYCGTTHSGMLAKVFTHQPKDFEEWLEKAGNEGGDMPPAEYGAKLFSSKTCNTCHSTDGRRIQGPTFKGVFGRTEKITGQGEITVDEAYIRESILNPTAKVVEGFPAVMPSFKGQLKDRQIDALIAYLKTIK